MLSYQINNANIFTGQFPSDRVDQDMFECTLRSEYKLQIYTYYIFLISQHCHFTLINFMYYRLHIFLLRRPRSRRTDNIKMDL